MIDFKKPPLHPRDEELAYFIDNKIIGTRKEEIKEHLLFCDECMGIMGEVKKKKKISKKIYAIAVSGLVASIALFFIIPTQNSKPFINFFIPNEKGTFLAAKTIEIKDVEAKNQELNDFLKRLTKSIDMSFSKNFKEAKEYLNNKKFESARESYSSVLNEIAKSKQNDIEKARASIFINYQILLLSIKEKDNESANEYKDIIKDDIRRLKLKESKEKG